MAGAYILPAKLPAVLGEMPGGAYGGHRIRVAKENWQK